MANKQTSNYELNQIAEIKVSYDPKYEPSERWQVRSSDDAYNLFRTVWDNDSISFQEEFLIAYLNRSNQVLGIYRHAKGTEKACLISVKQVLAVAIKANASGLIIAHNHPSSSLLPSDQDVNLTKVIRQASEVFDLTLLDHLILRKEEGFYSFADDGII